MSRTADARPAGRLGNTLRHPLAIAAIGALIGGWVLPAFARQWQDRQAERELKRELAIELDREATSAVVGAMLLITRDFPEAQTSDVRREEAERSRAEPRAREAYLEAVERERLAATAGLVATLRDWLVTRSANRSALTAYFPDASIAEQWVAFANGVTDYVYLAGRVPGMRSERLDRLAGLVGDARDDWALLETPPALVDEDRRHEYGEAARDVGGKLLLVKTNLIEDLLRADAAGFSTSRSELLHDLVPGLGAAATRGGVG